MRNFIGRWPFDTRDETPPPQRSQPSPARTTPGVVENGCNSREFLQRRGPGARGAAVGRGGDVPCGDELAAGARHPRAGFPLRTLATAMPFGQQREKDVGIDHEHADQPEQPPLKRMRQRESSGRHRDHPERHDHRNVPFELLRKAFPVALSRQSRRCLLYTSPSPRD